ncbi:MAG: hypothetical protein AAF892_07160 [Cyanobacteria bacterium P01_D01_bin.71]
MLNQFIQIRIQTRNAGLIATGCSIDGLTAMVDDSIGHAKRLVHGLNSRFLQRDRGPGGLSLSLGYQAQLRQLGGRFTPHFGWQWQQR